LQAKFTRTEHPRSIEDPIIVFLCFINDSKIILLGLHDCFLDVKKYPSALLQAPEEKQNQNQKRQETRNHDRETTSLTINFFFLGLRERN
jgi:hypothetical protein